MKKVRESLNEKFKSQSDPIEDMGIGTCQKNVEKLREKLGDMWDDNYEVMLSNVDRSQAIDTIEEISKLVDEIFGIENEDN
jgi:hypothetical protein